jgi:hypothetical protein
VLIGDAAVARSTEASVAVGVLDSRIRAEIAARAPDRVFVHAGVVAVDDRVIVIPGASFSGKTTLVGALIRGGASYFSDEFAVLDPDGRVHPYPKPLSIRNGEERHATTETSAGELGAHTATESARIGVIALTTYKPDASWQPQTGTGAAAALALFSHAVVAREQPQRVMSVVSKAVAGARLLESDRGEAAATAEALLSALGGR